MSRLSREIPKDSLELLLRIFKSGLTIAFTEYGGKVFDRLENDKPDHFKSREKGTKHGLYPFGLNFDEDKENNLFY